MFRNLERIEPTKARITFHAFIGGIIGAPIGVMTVACISSLIGSFKGIYFGFLDSIRPFEAFPFIMKSLDNIAEGSSNQILNHMNYLRLGAKIGPFIFAILGYWLSYYKWFKDETENEESKIDKPTNI